MTGSIKQILFLWAQYLLPQRFLSSIFGLITHCKYVWFKNALITLFVEHYKVDLTVAVGERVSDYADFNEFFTRPLKVDARPILADPKIITSPVDGVVVQMGAVNNGLIPQAKGKYFTVEALVVHNHQEFTNADFVTLYLAPKDYHRVHLPLAGQLISTTYIPGRLFSVNATATANIDNLFARNERLVCHFATEAGPMLIILIGAMLVGSIETVWGGVEQSTTMQVRDYAARNLCLAKGSELGRFNTGSSVIVLFANNHMQWSPRIVVGQSIFVGEELGLRNS